MKKVRSSNIELYRIVVMAAIVVYHLTTNTGLMSQAYAEPWSLRSVFILWFGAWGKTGINCFVLITGYFMCMQKITLHKVLNLVAMVAGYSLALYFVGCLLGAQQFSLPSCGAALISFACGINRAFMPSFIVLYLFIPFLNQFLASLTSRQHFYFLILSLVLFSVLPSLSFQTNFGCVGWYMVLYAVAAYVRLHPHPLFENRRLCGWGTIILLCCAAMSMIFGLLLGEKVNMILVYYWVFSSEKILAFLIAFASFMWFKNLKVPGCECINLIGRSTFAIFLIHDGALGPLRKTFWNEWMPFAYADASGLELIYMIGASLVIIFFICTICDLIRCLTLDKLERWFINQLTVRNDNN